MAVDCNEPELNMRYPVKTTVKSEFEPGKCVTTTYLWSDMSTKPPPRFESKGTFEMGKIAMNMDSTVQGTLLEGKTKLNILIDSGASRA